MIETEKLSIFNIEKFKSLYDNKYNSLMCDKGFFEYYNNESFMIKYYLRKQVHLLKYKNEYCGYIWHEYPIPKDIQCEIFALYIKEEYAPLINIDLFTKLNIYNFKFNTNEKDINDRIMQNLKCILTSKTIVMKMKKPYELFPLNNEFTYEKFEKGIHEHLRCIIQNAIFDRKGRIPITENDIAYEETEDYYIDNLSVFIKKNNIYAGYGQVIYSNNKYTIVNVGIIPSFRGYGYGYELVKYIVNLCKENNIEDLYIKVDSKNKAAYSLYSKIGFEDICAYNFWCL